MRSSQCCQPCSKQKQLFSVFAKFLAPKQMIEQVSWFEMFIRETNSCEHYFICSLQPGNKLWNKFACFSTTFFMSTQAAPVDLSCFVLNFWHRQELWKQLVVLFCTLKQTPRTFNYLLATSLRTNFKTSQFRPRPKKRGTTQTLTPLVPDFCENVGN